MTKYEVTIHLDPITYVIKAKDEEQAIEQAEELAMEESHYDLLKWADYSVNKAKK